MSIDNDTKLKLYMLIVNRYKDTISKSEEKSISELRQRCSPYDDFIKNLRDKILARFPSYNYPNNFSQAFPLILDYLKGIRNFEFGIPFWMSFQEIDSLKSAQPMEKAMLLCALMRSIDVKTARVIVSKNKHIFVVFEHLGQKNIVLPETSSVLSGESATKYIQENLPAYEFNDHMYETYEE